MYFKFYVDVSECASEETVTTASLPAGTFRDPPRDAVKVLYSITLTSSCFCSVCSQCGGCTCDSSRDAYGQYPLCSDCSKDGRCSSFTEAEE